MALFLHHLATISPFILSVLTGKGSKDAVLFHYPHSTFTFLARGVVVDTHAFTSMFLPVHVLRISYRYTCQTLCTDTLSLHHISYGM